MTRRVDPLFAYLSVLAVIQPARIQDIEREAFGLLDKSQAEALVEGGKFRTVHKIAREKGLVISVRKGLYFCTPQAKQLVRRAGLERSIDNRRLFLMKTERRGYR